MKGEIVTRVYFTWLCIYFYMFYKCYMRGVAVVHCLPKCSVSEFTNISGMVEFIKAPWKIYH